MCGKSSPIRKSKTSVNQGRRFLGCGDFEEGKKQCNYLYWIDPPHTEKEFEAKIKVLLGENGGLQLKC
ncbi:hypothetical protein RHMOL_Rhmol10G0192700 [Rhododendron molle]|uniref:Uncharacterized protein n=1 Tax=Rhododendron molle TaxID=49168 RepID=A0ACC0M4I3_RHOML|nr:hypothetical protein RHMOL_Rhmol10G0192700 [Rhododendron molle]